MSDQKEAMELAEGYFLQGILTAAKLLSDWAVSPNFSQEWQEAYAQAAAQLRKVNVSLEKVDTPDSGEAKL